MPATSEAIALAVAAADAVGEVKATDVTLLDVADLLALSDVFVVASTSSERQLKAAAERIEERLRERDRRPLRREGTPASGWMLLDFGDVICHLLLPTQRDTYALERLWGDVARIDPATGEYLTPSSRAPSSRAPSTSRT